MDNNFKNRLNKILSIVALVCVLIGFGFMVATFIIQGDAKTITTYISLGFYVVAIGIFAFLYYNKAFPKQKDKEQEKAELEELRIAYQSKVAQLEAEKEEAQDSLQESQSDKVD